jgi:Asp-tRNA(Asn)/Glu-tRNA(Gln) amidotransferase A subunit family amidase
VTDDLHYISATEARSLFLKKELSPVELMEAVIARAEHTEPIVNAFSETFFDEARAQAKEAARRYVGDRSDVRPLEGIPVAMKDEHHIKGYKHTRGSLVYKDQIADSTTPIAERVLEAGGIMHARTTNSEFSMAGFTHSKLWGVTRNPWNPEFSTHGSSGGAGAALAAGSTTLASGSDIGGSIRGPASANGVVGFRPPYGRVPNLPPINFDHYFVAGPLARTVSDLAMFQNVIAGPHPVDIASLRPKLEIPDELPGVEGWTVGLTTDLGGWPVDRTVEANTIAAAKAFEELGATVEPASFSVTPEEVRLAVFIHFNSIFGSSVKADLDNHRDLLNPATIDFIELGIRSTEGLGYLEGLMLEADIYRRLSADLSRFNVLLCPTLALPAFTAGEHYVDGGPLVNGQKTEHWVDAHFTCVFSVTARCPIVNVPTGFGDNGVPTGMQIVGRTYDDTSVFQAATAYERARPWFQDAQSRPSL